MEKIRILQVFATLNRGGAETMLMNLYRKIDRQKYHFDFVVHSEDISSYENEVLSLGGTIHRLPTFTGLNYSKYCKAWKTIIRNNKYDIIHGHVRSTASIYLSIAKKHNITTVAHSHNSSMDKDISGIVKSILQLPIRKVADYFIACSELSGKWLFGDEVCRSNRFFILPNSIDTGIFEYNSVEREYIRKKMMCSENTVFGHIGRFDAQKNHLFLIDVFYEIVKKNPKSILWLVGTGSESDRRKIEDKIHALNLDDKVIFLGVRDDIPSLLQAIDVIVFPSLFEGLPVSIVEAQAAGVPCLLSDAISKEIQITDCVQFQSLDDDLSIWAERALSLSKRKHQNTKQQIVDAHYDIDSNVKWLESFYSMCVNSNGE